MSFSGEVAFVAGGGGGMGLAIGNALIEQGARVAFADLKPAPADISPGPAEHIYFEGNLTDEQFVRESVDSSASRYGGLDYLINTAGVLWSDRDKSVTEMDMNVWDQAMAINVKSFALTSRFAIPHMQRGSGGAMVHFSSIDATGGDAPAQDAYGASKAAVIRLAKSLAIQFAGDNIRSNVILPGATVSPMRDDGRAMPRFASASNISGKPPWIKTIEFDYAELPCFHYAGGISFQTRHAEHEHHERRTAGVSTPSAGPTDPHSRDRAISRRQPVGRSHDWQLRGARL